MFTLAASVASGLIALAQNDKAEPLNGRTPQGDEIRRTKHVEVEALELRVQALRAGLKAEITDVRRDFDDEAGQAKAELDQARQTLEVARVALKEYVEGIFPQDEQSAEGQLKLAESELTKARDYYDWSTKMRKIGYISAAENLDAKLCLEKAQFSKKEAGAKLVVLRSFTKEKTIQQLKHALEAAAARALEAESSYQEKQRRAEQVRKDADNLKLNMLDDQIAKLLDQAVALSDQLAGMLQDILAEQAKAADKPSEAKARAQRLREVRAKAGDLSTQARDRLKQAIDLADRMRSRRTELRVREAELRKAREELERLNGQAGTAPRGGDGPAAAKPR
jgi:hypothetical protein